MGRTPTPTMSATATAALAATPTFSNIAGNLKVLMLAGLFSDPKYEKVATDRENTYQNGPINPHIWRTKVM